MTAEEIKDNRNDIVQAIIAGINECILVASPEGFEFVNPAFEKLTGYTTNEVMSAGFNFLKLVHPEDQHLFLPKDNKAHHLYWPLNSSSVEFRLINKSGEILYVEASHSPLKEIPGQLLIIIRDITSRKNAELELSQTLEKLRKTMMATIQAITLTIESRDPYTAGHQRRVSDLARSIATRLSWPTEKIDEVRMAALVHDLGKISVPAEILNKPGRLTPSEFLMIKEHPRVGYEILKTIEFPWPVAEIVLQHHERINGTGYPLGLKNGKIHPVSRVLAVADVVEAMLSHRPYRSAFSPLEVAAEIKNGSGISYDPVVVDACLDILKERYDLKLL
ncbi:MAG: HD-GYP domain-containing protein [Candidatus Aminicenantes bacterium]|nr:HD-GYP domain-containing protein [Candidatus Aminicenantes bacterium]